MHTTDWSYDFSSLPYWENHDVISGIYDEFNEIPETDTLCCLYSIAEVGMGKYFAFLAVLQNKKKPELLLNVPKGIFFPFFAAGNQGNLAFFKCRYYHYKAPNHWSAILLIDVVTKRFSYFNVDGYALYSYQVVERSETCFELVIDPLDKQRNERLQMLSPCIIDITALTWYPLHRLSAFPEEFLA